MFLEFFYKLRARGVPVTTHTWLALVEALAKGLHKDNQFARPVPILPRSWPVSRQIPEFGLE